jgi:hypothetical protein
MQHTEEHAFWLFIAVTQLAVIGKLRKRNRLMAIPPTDIQILFTNYDIFLTWLLVQNILLV